MKILLFILFLVAAAQTQPDITTEPSGTTGKNGKERKRDKKRDSRDQKRQSRDERKTEKKFTRQLKNMQKSMVR